MTIQDGLRLTVESEWCFSIGSCASDMKQRKKQEITVCVFFKGLKDRDARGLLLRRAPRCCGVRDLRAGMRRRREIVHGGGGRKLRVRRICNVAKNVVI